jgi:hypothetical protein
MMDKVSPTWVRQEAAGVEYVGACAVRLRLGADENEMEERSGHL